MIGTKWRHHILMTSSWFCWRQQKLQNLCLAIKSDWKKLFSFCFRFLLKIKVNLRKKLKKILILPIFPGFFQFFSKNRKKPELFLKKARKIRVSQIFLFVSESWSNFWVKTENRAKKSLFLQILWHFKDLRIFCWRQQNQYDVIKIWLRH